MAKIINKNDLAWQVRVRIRLFGRTFAYTGPAGEKHFFVWCPECKNYYDDIIHGFDERHDCPKCHYFMKFKSID